MSHARFAITGPSTATISTRRLAIHSSLTWRGSPVIASLNSWYRRTLSPDRMIIGGVQASTGALRNRSEEHTSEIQSLLRISYGVFSLKHKRHLTRGQDP